MSTANTTAPAPWHPRPADFQREIPIGEICGATVYGLRMWEEKGGEIWHFGARAELNGLDITAYPSLGDGREHLHIDGSEGLDSKGIDFSSLTGEVKFVNSAFSPLVQVADIIAYNIYRQFVQYGEKWEEEGLERLPTYEWFDKLGKKFRQGPDQRVQGFGVAKFPLLRRIRWSYTDE